MENKFVEVFPNKVTLSRSLPQSLFECRLTLTNLTDNYVIFKVYINNSAQYSANPSTSFIKPRDDATINIKRLDKVKN